ncbi:hypothetical protein EDD53_1650 [Pacificibacter maritimus]|uniref:DUF1489 family protein n=1 Tax=Pacificibacter maritimus TaxID=762213 RepID=A0A3N4UFK8_9RHOB|nr:DUF1489 domain-containing protein [Pacificibacter maritimus]RPE67245.1 hypothetical protein EDD53_1650 [Pacificibacter maritimus]
MTKHIHIVKLCVGIESVEDLEHRLSLRGGDTLGHVTRMRPKQEEALLNGGSLYWVIKGAVQARQEIAALEEVIGADGIKRCRIVLKRPLIRTQNAPRRPFQGWRYLKPEDAPTDMPKGRENDDELPAELAQSLADLGLV